jgi:hypothetical protein
MTAFDHIRAALEALLRDDIPERNRQCRLAKEAIRRDGILRATPAIARAQRQPDDTMRGI